MQIIQQVLLLTQVITNIKAYKIMEKNVGITILIGFFCNLVIFEIDSFSLYYIIYCYIFMFVSYLLSNTSLY